MSTTLINKNHTPQEVEEKNYLNVEHTVKSWLFTTDHKRIAMLYLMSILFFFFIGSIGAAFVRLELTSPSGQILDSDTYNKMFSSHGIVMVFLFLIPSIPATLGNFLIPMMIGAKDLAFPRLNLLSWYVFMAGGMLVLLALIMGGVDTGWTFYTPYSSVYSHSQVGLAITGIFLAGFSSILTGLNFVVTIHKMRAPGMTWFRLPLFVWAHYAAALIMILGTPVVAITLVLVVVERVFNIGVFNPNLGGDPVLFQHLFWFYSHPAVYIMILPSMGVVAEVIACFARKPIFGYHFVAFSSLAIAALGFLVWGHHMFITSQSVFESVLFSFLSYIVAIPSAIKVFNWTATLYKGRIRTSAPMIYALCFIGLFVIGGLTGLFLACLAIDQHVTATYFIVAHFHYIMVGGAIMGFLAGIHFWWPKMTGRMYPETWAKYAAILMFVGFNLTFFPQFILGFLGMPRRYHYYKFAPEYQFYHVISSAGSTILGVAYLIPVIYLIASLRKGPKTSSNPWDAKGLEWQTDSPPITHNFHEIPIVTEEAYAYNNEYSSQK